MAQDSGTHPARGRAGLGDPRRLDALGDAGLTAAPDAGMERFARLVSRLIDVPVALVSLVEADRQVFPGQIGLGEPWASSRETPLTHSLCQHVVTSGSPLVLPDIREDERTWSSLAIGGMGVVAYAGMPLTDTVGNVLGSLCAIDTIPRDWTRQELANLEDLAAACSAELRLRISSRHALEARSAAEVAQAEALDASGQARLALERSELQLRAAEVLADAQGVVDLRRRVGELITGDLKPVYVGVSLIEGQGVVRRLVDPDIDYGTQSAPGQYGFRDSWPTVRAVRENRLVTVHGEAQLRAQYGDQALEVWRSLGFESLVCVPLAGMRQVLGALAIAWGSHHDLEVGERAVLSAIAGYTAQAVERAVFVDERITVAHQLQRAMLTELPSVPGLDMAAAYLPAAVGEMVGGDWYDAYPLPDPELWGLPHATADPEDHEPPYEPGRAVPMALTVGDITGHDMDAATVMGQVRSMLRQATCDHPGQGPAHAMTALENSCRTLGLPASGTAVHAHIAPAAAGWELTWTNAGHPSPLLAHADGRVEALEEHDVLVHPALPVLPRHDHRRVLRPGSTLLLYTDGLIEHRGRSYDVSTERVAEMLSAGTGRPLPDLLREIAADVAGESAGDDVAMLAVRVPALPGPGSPAAAPLPPPGA
ncbi:Serine phosphatase RsbU, regulator of sigma subunit [Streptomyces sp. DvalAA-14]|uniref:GAF domain-containing SpoIIE family protein phosphatase n=1 Tax=unclassified Streptomyces TaxID=2593676 RepID=UPI00081B88DD|nr:MULTISPECIES: SpoIIE family protein phosphatase [unclassified Streptomyces]MYS24095.1 SpoIIE family protein phosphatase [Streptomyces sp. SID4948]SCE42565.1 Serine phosphatase RsbU, regulator of sigma subunit [Streptomyces sp. DvalAA-14]